MHCPECDEAVMPVVRDGRGRICPVCNHEFDPEPIGDHDPDEQARRWFGTPEGAHYI